MHKCLAAFYSAHKDGQPEPSAEELQAVFSDTWDQGLDDEVPVLFTTRETPGKLKDTGVAIAAAFHEYAERPHQVVGVEEPFSIELTDERTGEVLPRFVGFLDAVVRDQDGTYAALEHKSGARKWSPSRVGQDLQLSAYSLALGYQGLGDDARLRVQVLTKTKTPELQVLDVVRGERDHQDFLETASGVVAAIRANIAYPVRDWPCQSCPYASRCVAG